MTTAETHGNYWFLGGGSFNHFKLVAVIINSTLYQPPIMSPAGSLLCILTPLEMNPLWDISSHHITGKYQDTLSMLGHQPTVCPWQQDTDPEPVHPVFIVSGLSAKHNKLILPLHIFCSGTDSSFPCICPQYTTQSTSDILRTFQCPTLLEQPHCKCNLSSTLSGRIRREEVYPTHFTSPGPWRGSHGFLLKEQRSQSYSPPLQWIPFQAFPHFPQVRRLISP